MRARSKVRAASDMTQRQRFARRIDAREEDLAMGREGIGEDDVGRDFIAERRVENDGAGFAIELGVEKCGLNSRGGRLDEARS